jgi:hypothetical protein
MLITKRLKFSLLSTTSTFNCAPPCTIPLSLLL